MFINFCFSYYVIIWLCLSFFYNVYFLANTISLAFFYNYSANSFSCIYFYKFIVISTYFGSNLFWMSKFFFTFCILFYIIYFEFYIAYFVFFYLNATNPFYKANNPSDKSLYYSNIFLIDSDENFNIFS